MKVPRDTLDWQLVHFVLVAVSFTHVSKDRGIHGEASWGITGKKLTSMGKVWESANIQHLFFDKSKRKPHTFRDPIAE